MTVSDWLLDSDPSIRWQVMRDLTGAPAGEVAAERANTSRLSGIDVVLDTAGPGPDVGDTQVKEAIHASC